MLRLPVCIVVFFAMLAGACYAGAADAAIPAERVAVMNLKVTGESSEQVREWLPVLIEDILLQRGWTLLVRGERMQHIQQELNLPGIDPDTKVEANKLYGATALLELTARVHVGGMRGALGFGRVTLGDYVKVSIDLNGQIVDVRTGTLKSSVKVGGSAGGLKTVAFVALKRNWNVHGAGIDLAGVRDSLAGKAADKAALKLVDRLDKLYGSKATAKDTVRQLAASNTKTTLTADADDTIMLSFADTSTVQTGSMYGVYRGDNLIAELEIVKIVSSKQVQARIVKQSLAIKATDRARKMPLTIIAE